jgi:hypothetical protein
MNFEEVRLDPIIAGQLTEETLKWWAWLARAGLAQPEALKAKFPHVLNKIAAAWGSALAMTELMQGLTLDLRGGRQGFPFDVLVEIQALNDAHVARYPRASPSDIWARTHLR